MTRQARSLAVYTHLIAIERLRLIVRGDAMPREDEPICIMMLLVIR